MRRRRARRWWCSTRRIWPVSGRRPDRRRRPPGRDDRGADRGADRADGRACSPSPTLDDDLVAALRTLTAEPADLTSTDGFCVGRAQPAAERAAHGCWTPWTCSASPTACSRCSTGTEAAALPARAAQAQRLDRVLARLAAVARRSRYERLRAALRPAARAGGDRHARPGRVPGLRRHGASRVMAAAVDVVEAAGMTVDDRRRTAGTSAPRAALAPLQPRTGRRPAPALRRRHLPRLAAAAAPRGGRVTDVDQVGDPVGAVDALVAGVDPGLSSPGVESRDVVLVTGPWLAGATGVIAALRDRLPEHEFVEADDIRPAEAPTAVVFVVSAVAPIDRIGLRTDRFGRRAHRPGDRGGVQDRRAPRLARRARRQPVARWLRTRGRYADVPWVGVAAAPDMGEPTVDELVDAAARTLADADVEASKQVARVGIPTVSAISRHDKRRGGRRPAGTGDGIARAARRGPAGPPGGEVRAHHRTAQPDPAGPGAAGVLRPQPLHVRAVELEEDASAMTRRRLPEFETYVGARIGEVVGEVEAGITAHLADVATELEMTAPEPPPPRLAADGAARRR